MPTERYEQIRTFSFLTIVTIIFLINLKIIFNIIKKCKNRFEPINVFWLNYFLTTSLMMCFWFMIIVDTSFNILRMFFNFCPQNLFGLFVFISSNLDVTTMQMDMFLAVYWNIAYKGRVTTKKAVIVCFLNKFISVIITVFTGMTDSGYFSDSDSRHIFQIVLIVINIENI